MAATVEKEPREPPRGNAGAENFAATGEAGARPQHTERHPACYHCGQPCPESPIGNGGEVFCCEGCRVVHDLLAENGLGEFYRLSDHPGVRIGRRAEVDRWACLDEPSVRDRLIDFSDGKTSRVTFHVPAMHCVACVWLLENLFRLHPGIGRSQVNFLRREVMIQFAVDQVPLSGVAALLASLGYEPQLHFGALEPKRADTARRRRWLQLGIAGFAFGNIMLLSIPVYFGLDDLNGPWLRHWFGWLSLALATPVLVYSAGDYWRSAWVLLRRRMPGLDVPIALGLAALYLRSVWEIVAGHGLGYLDSLVALVFFLLCGRAFQQKTYERMAFDRDYRCFFPLAVRRRARGAIRPDAPSTPEDTGPNADAQVESVSISSVRVGDQLLVRNGELIPADARLVSGRGCLDYSFVTGEAEPVDKQAGDTLYAGGKQLGATIEIETVRPVSQSYLTSLWEDAAFRQERSSELDTLTDRYSRRFTLLVIAVALAAAAFWVLGGEAGRGLNAFVAVLIVACPCALALAAPFTLGTAQRWLARAGVFLKSADVLETLARVNTVVFDKTGTLTAAGARNATFDSERPLSDTESVWVRSVARHSTHPHAGSIAATLSNGQSPFSVQRFVEVPGGGIEGWVEGHHIRLGSRAWLAGAGIPVPPATRAQASVSYLAINYVYRGAFTVQNTLRPDVGDFVQTLGRDCELALLSGDNPAEADRFRRLFGPAARLHFNQTPFDKLGFIRQLQASGGTVMMVGDGLNDAGALKQSDVGVAVIENTGAFSPASDVILEGRQVPALDRIVRLARWSTRVIRVSFVISAAYNVAGITIAAAGVLSPVICAVLMPLSSISVVLFACGATTWAARKEKLLCQ